MRREQAKSFVARFGDQMAKRGLWMSVSLILIWLIISSVFWGPSIAQQQIARRPNIHFDLDSFDVQLAACHASGEGDLVLRATSARSLRQRTEFNARTDVEVRLQTEGQDAMIELQVDGQTEVSLNTVGKAQQVLANKQEFHDILMPHPCGIGITELFSIDRRVKLSDIENYLAGVAAGNVSVSVSVAHEALLSAQVSCPDGSFDTVDFGTLRWQRNYVVAGNWHPDIGRLDHVQIGPDPNRPEISDATLQ